MGQATIGGPTAGFRDVLAHRELRWLVAHHLAAGSGQSFGTVAVATALYQQTGSAMWVAAAAASRLVPYLVCAGPAGALADRSDRRRLLTWSALLRAVVLAGLVAAVAVEAPPLAAVALVFVGTALGTGSFPALLAVIPATVPEHHLPPATAVVNTVETAAWVVGPAAGGLLLLGGSPEVALLANVALFLVGAALLRPVTDKPAPSTGAEGQPSFGARLARGAQVIATTPAVRAPLVVVVAVNVALGAAPIVLLLVAQASPGLGPHAYAVLSTALGAGGFCGVAVTNRLAARPDTTATLTASALAGTIPLLGLLVVDQLAVAVVLVALAGAGMVVTEVVALTSILRSLPETVIGGVFGLVDSCLVAAVLVGSVVAAPLAAWLGLPIAIATFALVIPAAGAIAARRDRPLLGDVAAPPAWSSSAA